MEMKRRTYPKDFGTNEVELYNLDEDIGETTNLAVQQPEIVTKLQALCLPPEKPSFSPPAARPEAAQGRPKTGARRKRKPKSTATIDGSTSLGAENVLPAPPNRFLHYAVEPPGYVFDTVPFWHDGAFHLFFLNPVFDSEGKKTGIKWSHAKTEDFVHWKAMPDALLPGKLDRNCWTGSLIEKDGTFYLFYTGKSLPDRPDPNGDQKIMLATSTDLVHFEKQPGFTFYADGEIYWNRTINGPLDLSLSIHNQRDESFRDPEVFWNPEHDEYWMVLHAREAKTQRHCFGVYRSEDLLTWKPRQPLEISVPVHQSNIDCPDLFQLGDKWVLTFSGGPRYAITDKSTGPYSGHHPADHNLFVPKTTRDGQGRVLVAGTVRPDIGVAGGRGSMVREYYLSHDGRLLQRPLPEVVAAFPEAIGTLDDLAENVVTGQARRSEEGLKLTRGQQVPRVSLPEPADFLADFTVTLDADSIFRLNFRRGGGQKTMQTFEISTAENHIRLGTIARHSDNTRPVNDRLHAVPAGKPIRVRLFAVGTILTAFVDDRYTLTMNAVSLDNTRLIAEAFQGSATIHDFTLRGPKRVQTSGSASGPDALDSTGRADETVIVLWSDHGYHLGDKDSVVKFTLWEMACRVPLVIVAPGVTEPGIRIDTPVDLVDLYPTLVELAGLPKKPGLDGKSLLPLLKNPKAARDAPAITTFLKGNHAVVTNHWRFIHYADGSEELYRIEDLWNHENLAGDAEHADTVRSLRTWLPGPKQPGRANPVPGPRR